MPGHGKDRWSGIFPSLCTPFGADGGIDAHAQRDVVRFALSCRANGIVCQGLAGEVTRLTVDERKRLCDLILEEVHGAVPVLVGVGGEAEHTATDLARHAERAGASGLVVPPPMTAHAPSHALERYFLAVAERADLPVMIQDAPAYLGVALSPAMINHLAAAQPNIQYVKIEAGPEETAHWVDTLEQPVRVFTGDAGLHLLTTLRAGAVGNIPAVEFTDLLVAAYEAEIRGDRPAADAMHARLLPYLVFGMQTLDHCNGCGKAVLVRRGVLTRGGLRPPAPELTPLAQALVDQYVERLSREDGFVGSATPAPRAETRQRGERGQSGCWSSPR